MTLVGLILTLVILGLVMYLINTLVPMDAGIKKILNIAVILIVVLWLIQSFGLLGPIGNIRVR